MSWMSHYNVHNLYPAEAWVVCEMFMIAAFKVMEVTLQCTQSLSSRSMGSVWDVHDSSIQSHGCHITMYTIFIQQKHGKGVRCSWKQHWQSWMSHYNVHNLYPAEAWEVCEMFMIAAFKVMDVTLQCTQSLSSRSMGSVCDVHDSSIQSHGCHITMYTIFIQLKHGKCVRCSW
jgi:hypothetical protein